MVFRASVQGHRQNEKDGFIAEKWWFSNQHRVFSYSASSLRTLLPTGHLPSFDFCSTAQESLLLPARQETKEMLIGQDTYFLPLPHSPLVSRHEYTMWEHLHSKESAVYIRKPHHIKRSQMASEIGYLGFESWFNHLRAVGILASSFHHPEPVSLWCDYTSWAIRIKRNTDVKGLARKADRCWFPSICMRKRTHQKVKELLIISFSFLRSSSYTSSWSKNWVWFYKNIHLMPENLNLKSNVSSQD